MNTDKSNYECNSLQFENYAKVKVEDTVLDKNTVVESDDMKNVSSSSKIFVNYDMPKISHSHVKNEEIGDLKSDKMSSNVTLPIYRNFNTLSNSENESKDLERNTATDKKNVEHLSENFKVKDKAVVKEEKNESSSLKMFVNDDVPKPDSYQEKGEPGDGDGLHCNKMSPNFTEMKNKAKEDKRMEEGEEDEYVSSLLSVHFDGGGKDEGRHGQAKRRRCGGKEDINISLIEKLYSKRGGLFSNTRENEESSTSHKAQGIGDGRGDFCNTSHGTDGSSSSQGTAGTKPATSGKDDQVRTLMPSPIPISLSIPDIPEKRPHRKRPPPKTYTVYNEELTQIASADDICLNIRLMEKNARKKKFPEEKTKYRKRNERKTEPESEEGNQSSQSQEEKDSGMEADLPFQCTYCGMSFIHNSRLKLHERCHTGEKPYPCPFCDKAFSQTGFLKTHLKIHTGEKPFKCSICDYAFRLSTTLGRHMRIHTGECPYICQICSRSFNQKSTLDKHVKVHSEDKPHVCELCHKGFRLIDTLRIHMQSHAQVRSFICSVCDKAFKTKGTLLSHIKTHTHTRRKRKPKVDPSCDGSTNTNTVTEFVVTEAEGGDVAGIDEAKTSDSNFSLLY